MEDNKDEINNEAAEGTCDCSCCHHHCGFEEEENEEGDRE